MPTTTARRRGRPSPPLSPVGSVIEAALRRRSLTLTELADRGGFHRRTLLRWMSGQTWPREPHTSRLAGALELTAAERGMLDDAIAHAPVRHLRGRPYALTPGALLRAAREARGLTEDDVASALDVPVATVRRWERNADLPGPLLEEAVAELLRLSEDERRWLAPATAIAGPAAGWRRRRSPLGLLVTMRAGGLPVSRGSLIAFAREELGLGREELAKRLRIPASVVGHLEADVARPGQLLTARLAAELRLGALDVAYLSDGAPRLSPVGEILRPSRIALGLRSAASLADRLGVTPWTVANWELGICRPARSAIPRIAAVLGPEVAERIAAAPAPRRAPRRPARRPAARPPAPLSVLLRRARVARGLRRTDLAHHLGVSEPTVAGWEHGLGYPDAVTFRRLVHVLRLRGPVLHRVVRALRRCAQAPRAAIPGPLVAGARAIRAASARRRLTRLGLAATVRAPLHEVIGWWDGRTAPSRNRRGRLFEALPFTVAERAALSAPDA